MSGNRHVVNCYEFHKLLTKAVTVSSQDSNHKRPAEFHCRGTVIVEQSSCCFTETRDDAAYLQVTPEVLSVPHLMS